MSSAGKAAPMRCFFCALKKTCKIQAQCQTKKHLQQNHRPCPSVKNRSIVPKKEPGGKRLFLFVKLRVQQKIV